MNIHAKFNVAKNKPAVITNMMLNALKTLLHFRTDVTDVLFFPHQNISLIKKDIYIIIMYRGLSQLHLQLFGGNVIVSASSVVCTVGFFIDLVWCICFIVQHSNTEVKK